MTLNEASLEKRFGAVSTSQGSIQSLSFFCLHYKNHHKKIAQIWLRCLQKAKVPHRLTLIYLANDIVQNAKRKNTLSFIEDFKCILKETVPYLRDDKIKKSVERVFSIWQDRSIFDSKFTTELKNALNYTGKAPQNDLMECLNRLAGIEESSEKLRNSSDEINYTRHLKNEIDERSKLARLLEDSLVTQRKLLKESEDQLTIYKSQLDYIQNLDPDRKT